MIRRALLAAVVVSFMAGSASAQIELLVDPDLTAYLHNPTAKDIGFDSYQITADGIGGLDPAGWYSISDRQPAGKAVELMAELGALALGFGELSPTPQQLAENNLVGDGILKAGAKFSLGKPFGEGGYYVSFFTKQSSNGLFIPRVPEPSTLILATLAGAGLLAFRRPSARSLRPS
jgi:hypothetical protein